MKWQGSEVKLRSPHESVGWLGDGPGGVIIVTECKNPNCGCHEAVEEAKKEGLVFMHNHV